MICQGSVYVTRAKGVRRWCQEEQPLEHRTAKCHQLLQEKIRKSLAKVQGIHYDCSTKRRTFSPGDEVLILLAAESNKLLMIEIERTVLHNSAVGECD